MKPDSLISHTGSKGCSHWQCPEGRLTWRRARPACASVALAFAMLSAPAQAQDDDGYLWLDRMNQIVVTATRTPVEVGNSAVTRPADLSVQTQGAADV